MANPKNNNVYIVVKTVESYNEEETGTKNVIKTLRIYDPAFGFKCIKQILLEQIKSFRVDENLKHNHVSILFNETLNTIYFYRRIGDPSDSENYDEETGYTGKSVVKTKMRLFKYDLTMDKLSEIEGYDLEGEDQDSGQWHVLFAQKFGV